MTVYVLEWECAAASVETAKHSGSKPSHRSYPWGQFEPPTFWPRASDIIRTLYRNQKELWEWRFPANTLESGIQARSMVGLFPHGAADCGAQDMSGNVWEWCSTSKVPYPISKRLEPDDAFRTADYASKKYILRGGSWQDEYDWASSSFRFYASPNTALDNIGFRLVRVSPHNNPR